MIRTFFVTPSRKLHRWSINTKRMYQSMYLTKLREIQAANTKKGWIVVGSVQRHTFYPAKLLPASLCAIRQGKTLGSVPDVGWIMLPHYCRENNQICEQITSQTSQQQVQFQICLCIPSIHPTQLPIPHNTVNSNSSQRTSHCLAEYLQSWIRPC